MKTTIEYYLSQPEPLKSCLLALRDIILNVNSEITHGMKYGMPFFCFHGRMMCYLWIHKKFKQPYLGLVDGNKFDHPDLLTEKRARMKILLIYSEDDLPVDTVKELVNKAVSLLVLS